MKTIEQPDGGAIILFDEGPVPFKDAKGRTMLISLSDAREMLDTLIGIQVVMEDDSIDKGAYTLNAEQMAHLKGQIRILYDAIRDTEEEQK